MSEIWKPIHKYEAVYEISSMGRVRRIAGGKGSTPGRILTCKTATNGYHYIDLSQGDAKTRFLIHRLVFMAFLGDPPLDKPWVNHKNGNKVNNVPSNLEWVSASENNEHAYRIGLKLPTDTRGEKNPRAKLTLTEVQAIREARNRGISQRQLARQYGVAKSTIYWIDKRRNWSSIPSEWPAAFQVQEFPFITTISA